MRIFQIASEYAPLAKVGGLGDVVQGLSKQLTKENHKVEVILPLYGFLTNLPSLKAEKPLEYFYDNQTQKTAIFSLLLENVKIIFIDHPLFQKEKIYGFPDDTEKFLLFSYFAFQYLKREKEPIDVVHLHDWHSALVSLFHHFDPISIKKIILTLHNPLYQASAFYESFRKIDPKLSVYFSEESGLLDEESLKTLNFLKAGITFSHKITTVSPTFAKELLEECYVENLHSLFQKKKNDFSGILNGIDTSFWDPDKDIYLIQNYRSADRMDKILKAKSMNKKHLQNQLKLEESPTFLVSNIGRIADQKGPELIMDALEHTIENGGQFVLLGCCETFQLKNDFENLQKKYKNHPRVSCIFSFDEKLARLIYAASDFLIIPSHYEPCGLTQMISMRYGTIPIARKTGGLADTVFEKDHFPKKHNGYIFVEPESKALVSTLNRAFRDFVKNPLNLYEKIEHGMKEDHSWEKASKDYLRVYSC